MTRFAQVVLVLFGCLHVSAGSFPIFETTAAVGVACTAYAAACFKVVTTGDECLVERCGCFNRRLGPGWHLLARPFESVSMHATTREQVVDIPPQQCYTLDNAPIKADAVVYMRIFSMEAARYQVEAVYNAILNLCLTQLREEVGKLTLDESFSSRERINKALLSDLNKATRSWGVEITRVEIQNLEPSPVILSAMELQMAAERKKRAAILHSEGERTTLTNEAEGHASAVIADAEARKQAMILAAEGESERLRLEADGLAQSIDTVVDTIERWVAKEKTQDNGSRALESALQLLMLNRYMDTQGKFASSNGTKVLMFPTKDSIPLTYEGLRGLVQGT